MEINQLLFLFIDVVLWAIALILLIPVAVLFLECSAAFFSGFGSTAETKAPRPKIAVLIPAYNEAAGIAATISTILPQLTSQDRLLVIADNCTDATAEIARNSGASAIERQDTQRKGKGYALDFGLQSIESDPPEVVIMVDADCICQPDSIEKLARVAVAEQRPVQATYLMEQPPNPTPKDSISALAFLVKNLVRPSGLKQLGFPSLLTGLLEVETKRHLHHARTEGAGELSVVSSHNAHVWRIELNVVECVESFGTELQIDSFFEYEILECRKIEIPPCGRGDDVASGGAEL